MPPDDGCISHPTRSKPDLSFAKQTFTMRSFASPLSYYYKNIQGLVYISLTTLQALRRAEKTEAELNCGRPFASVQLGRYEW